jgi:hypothetical protein
LGGKALKIHSYVTHIFDKYVTVEQNTTDTILHTSTNCFMLHFIKCSMYQKINMFQIYVVTLRPICHVSDFVRRSDFEESCEVVFKFHVK